MRNAIENELDLLSAVRNANVLVAMESGSRAWEHRLARQRL